MLLTKPRSSIATYGVLLVYKLLFFETVLILPLNITVAENTMNMCCNVNIVYVFEEEGWLFTFRELPAFAGSGGIQLKSVSGADRFRLYVGMLNFRF